MIKAIDFSKWNDLTQKKDLPKNTWLSTEEVILLKGKFKTGKSLFAQQLMTAVATGRNWFDEYFGKVKTYGIFCEDDEDKLKYRQFAINESYKLNIKSHDLINNVRLIPRRGENNLLMIFDNDKHIGQLTPYFEELLRDIQLFQPKLVVLDSAPDLFWGDEDNKFHFKQFMQNCCARIARQANCTVFLCKHDNSGEEEYSDKVWYLIKPEIITDERELYGYGIHCLRCYKDKIFHGVGDHQEIECRY
ncbi:uncharacterized protein TNCT_218131 [Trichonephila clavata]|uniref:AAA domain-containing protein n=1 Tax=Trichonephila clavata TaxID=2740835 RepID=A0A8X6LLK3_TRICU|nr:uncharacterized protein TNCT_218131 [Trichonephila clavata]